MRRFLQVLGIVVVLILVYAVVVGLGLTRSFKRHKETKIMKVINDFEYLRYDYDWTTDGYAKMEPSTENPTHGKRCAKITFLLRSQFVATPAPDAKWFPQLVLDTKSITKLDFYDWHDFTSLKMDVFNPQDKPVSWFVQIADSHTFVFNTSGPLTPKKVTNISIPLEDLVSQRVDLSNILSLKFWIDTAGFDQPVVVYLDYLRLEAEPVAQPKKK